MRSADAISSLTEIVRYSYSFVVDNQGGRGITTPPTFINTTSAQEQQTISIPKNNLTDGDTIVVWLRAIDVDGSTDTIQFKVGVDRTPPNILPGDKFTPATAANSFTSR